MPKRAENLEALAPLIELCKSGRLFDVQEWIAAGKPVNPPLIQKKGTKARSPLEVAIERGFHSLVKVLLQGEAAQEPEGYDSPMNRALRARRFDIVQLLVDHGFDPKSVDMGEVFASWDPQIMSYFIERGADIRAGNPFARALCDRIRTALRVFKESRDHQPDIQEQANIALRHHCKEGNLKWVSLMLWAGADPHKPGSENPDEKCEEEEHGLSAVEFAALYEHFEILELKPIRATEVQQASGKVLSYLTKGEGTEVLKRLLRKGVNPNDQVNGGCSAIQSCLNQMGWERYFGIYSWQRDANGRSLDSSDLRDRMKAIHLLARHGAKWIPEDKYELNSARKSLLHLAPEYTLEFVWIMTKYRACDPGRVEALLRTPKMKSHTGSHRAKLTEILASWD